MRVHHVALGLNWAVREVLGSWTHRGWPEQTYRKPVVERRLRLRVFGPLPGRPEQNGEFVMIATAYGDRHSWWIRPELPGQQQPASAAAAGRSGMEPRGAGRCASRKVPAATAGPSSDARLSSRPVPPVKGVKILCPAPPRGQDRAARSLCRPKHLDVAARPLRGP